MQKLIDLNITNKQSASEIVVDLISEGYKVSDWILDISRRLNSEVKGNYDLWIVSLSDLGFDKATKIKDFYLKLESTGFSTIPPEVALMLRKIYTNQKNTEWMRIATPLDSMVDRDGVPHLPKLGSALGNLYIETYWAWPEAIFHPHNQFIVEKL